MTVLISAAVIVVLAQLIGIKRKTSGDVLHLLAVLISAAGAYILSAKAAPKAVSFAAEKLKADLSAYPLLTKIAEAAAVPAIFTLLFLAMFIVIGFIFHLISKIGKSDKKANIPAKLLLNLISGVLIAACLAVPAVFYPPRLEKVAEAAKKAGIDTGVTVPDLSGFAAPDYLDPLAAPFGRFEYEGKEYTVDEGIKALAFLSEVAGASVDAGKIGETAQEVQKDKNVDELSGYLSTELAGESSEEAVQVIMESPESFSVKLRAAEIDLLLEAFMSRPVDKHIPLAEIIRIADEESCRLAASSLSEDLLKQYTDSSELFAKIIESILTSIPKAKAGQTIIEDREAQEIESIFGLIESRLNGSTPKITDIDKLVRAISTSEIIRQTVVTATEGGTVKDPWGVGGVLGRNMAQGVMTRIERSVSVKLDDLTKQSLKAFFGLN